MEKLLAEVFGHVSFRPGQRESIEASMDGRDVLLVLPTGGGKSLCYQLPALSRFRKGRGPTLVISPLIALMEDQVEAARSKGIPIETVHSGMHWSDQKEALDRARSSALLLVSPERVAVARFRRWLQKIEVSAVAVDEAHCVSEWGHDFRPAYRKLGVLKEELGVPVMAVTATATEQVRDDITQTLALVRPMVHLGGFERPNLTLSVEPHVGQQSRTDRIIELLHEEDLGKKGDEGRAVIYGSSRRRVARLAKALRAAGFDAGYYHAGRTDGARSQAASKFLEGRTSVLVATTAYGMGIDLPDIRLVLHAQAPTSLESWYQQVGRAGRDGLPSRALLLWSLADVKLREKIVGQEEHPGLARGWAALRRMVEGAACREASVVAYFTGKPGSPCGRCDACVTPGQVTRGVAPMRAQKDALKHAAIEKRARADAWTFSEEARDQMVAFVSGMKRPVGKHVVAGGLRGSKAKRIRRARFEENPHFGAFQGVPERAIVQELEGLLAEGRLAPRGKKYPTLWMPDKRVRPTVSSRPKPKTVRCPLRAALKNYRRREARRRRWKAYQVFDNKTLEAMAVTRPGTLEDLAAIRGMGPKRVAKFGEGILALLASFRD